MAIKGAFIEAYQKSPDKFEYRLFFRAPVDREQIRQNCGNHCRRNVPDLPFGTREDGKPQVYFGMVVTPKFAESLRKTVPIIETAGSSDERYYYIARGFQKDREEKQAQAAAKSFHETHPTTATKIADEGWSLQPYGLSRSASLLLPHADLQAAHEAFLQIAPDAEIDFGKVGHRDCFRHPPHELITSDHRIAPIIKTLVSAERVKTHFDVSDMDHLSLPNDAAVALRDSVKAIPALEALLKEKAYFFEPFATYDGSFGIVFANLDEAKTCLMMLKQIPALAAAKLEKENPSPKELPKIDFSECDPLVAEALPTFAGHYERKMMGFTDKTKRTAGSMNQIKKMVGDEHPGHPAAKDGTGWGLGW